MLLDTSAWVEFFKATTKGKEMAKVLSEIGVVIGCKDARNWVFNKDLMQFLVVNNLSKFR